MNRGGSQDHDQESISHRWGERVWGGEGQHLGKGAQLLSKQDKVKKKKPLQTTHNHCVCMRLERSQYCLSWTATGRLN